VSAADILTGPAQRTDQFQLRLNDSVSCEFDKPGSEKSGNTAKFDCRITRVESSDGRVQVLTPEMDEDPVKVKFRPDNREIYAEPASTRLLWALGFYADSMFPVRLTCLTALKIRTTGKARKPLVSSPRRSSSGGWRVIGWKKWARKTRAGAGRNSRA
jgi:hypothetical protein